MTKKIANEAKTTMSAKDKSIARDVFKADQRDEPMAAGPGATLKANRKMLLSKYGKDWKRMAGLTEGKQINEGVLDDIDDDGFMAKRQLYDLAKYSVELHRMIQDTDNLEPWVQAKITKAADYIDTVKHYLEYQDVRGGEEATVDFGMDDIADVDQTLDDMVPQEPEAPMEDEYYEDEYYEETYESLDKTSGRAREIYQGMLEALRKK